MITWYFFWDIFPFRLGTDRYSYSSLDQGIAAHGTMGHFFDVFLCATRQTLGSRHL
jgi:hypothetical protein